MSMGCKGMTTLPYVTEFRILFFNVRHRWVPTCSQVVRVLSYLPGLSGPLSFFGVSSHTGQLR